jgi:hypothetical protein
MSTSATIKLFLPRGDAKSLRTAEISNWTGKAVAAPRTELEELLKREELEKAGVYILTGTDPGSGRPRAYIGEAEIIRERLKQHKTKEFWVSAIVFVSKDENLTKAHVRFLESRLLAEAAQVGRFDLEQNQAGGARLPIKDLATPISINIQAKEPCRNTLVKRSCFARLRNPSTSQEFDCTPIRTTDGFHLDKMRRHHNHSAC